jgi:hypothetical protein
MACPWIHDVYDQTYFIEKPDCLPDGRSARCFSYEAALEMFKGKLTPKTRLKSLITRSRTLFNAGARGACESVIKKIEMFHPKQSRRVLGVRWPFKISNKALYEKCSAKSLWLAIRLYHIASAHPVKDPETFDLPSCQYDIDHSCIPARDEAVRFQNNRYDSLCLVSIRF